MFPTALLILALQSTPDPASPPPEPPGDEPEIALPDPKSDAEQLLDLEDELTRALFVTRPWLAAVGDEVDRAPELGRIGRSALEEWSNELHRLELRARAIDEYALPPDRGLDVRWLESWIRLERLLLATTKPARQNPLHYVEGVERSLAAAARPAPSGVVTAMRVRNLAARLERVPATWDEARQQLERLSQPVCRRAAAHAERVVRRIAERYRPLADRLAEPEREGYRATCDEVIARTRELIAWLEERAVSTADEPRYLPTRTWKQLVAYATGEEPGTDELHLQLLREISDRRARVGKHATPVAIVDEALEPTRITTRIEALAVELSERARAADLIPPGRPGFRVRARAAEGATLDPPVCAPASLGVWELDLVLPGPEWGAGPTRTRRNRLSPAGRPALALRFGPLGETLAAWAALASSTKTRAQFENPLRRTAFGLYATDWALRRDGLLSTDERVRALVERELLLEAARLLAALELHGGLNELEIAIDHFVAHTGVDRETAEWEVVQTAIDPLHGAAFLLYLATVELEGALAEEVGEAAAVRATIDRLLSHTAAPVRALAR